MTAFAVPDFPSLVATHLFYGRDRAVTLSKIAEDMECPRRLVEKAIEQLALDGTPVVTGSDGAYLTMTDTELDAAAAALRSRALTIMRRALALRLTARRMRRSQQTELWAS